MPTALVINPNTSEVMTEDIAVTARRVFQPPWSAKVVAAPSGPESLESWTDYHIAALAIWPLLDSNPEVEGIVLACFGDPGLFPLKELSPVPVVGIAEASISLSLLLGARFGILAGMTRAVALMDSMVATYGLEARYAGTVPLDMRVLDFEKDRAATLQVLEAAGRKLQAQGAEVILLGCAGLTSFVPELQVKTRMPVIDPVEAGCRMLQTLVSAGLNTSHIGLFSRPAPQNMNNVDEFFQKKMANALRKPRNN